MATSVVVAGGVMTFAASSATAQPCISWAAVGVAYDPVSDEYSNVYRCTAYLTDPSTVAPPDPKADPTADPGAGSGAGRGAKPGSPQWCSDVADEISLMQAEIERLKARKESLLFDIQTRENDFAETMRKLVLAVGRTDAARQAKQAAWNSYVAGGGETAIQFDSRGKPSHGDPDVEAAELRLGVANANETRARADAAYAAGRLNESNDQLSAVKLAAAAADRTLAAALDRQAAEKCKP
jgi:FtsZ-binding cell division protein ZapB